MRRVKTSDPAPPPSFARIVPYQVPALKERSITFEPWGRIDRLQEEDQLGRRQLHMLPSLVLLQVCGLLNGTVL